MMACVYARPTSWRTKTSGTVQVPRTGEVSFLTCVVLRIKTKLTIPQFEGVSKTHTFFLSLTYFSYVSSSNLTVWCPQLITYLPLQTTPSHHRIFSSMKSRKPQSPRGPSLLAVRDPHPSSTGVTLKTASWSLSAPARSTTPPRP